jgi:CheY-like chemotaxis protein
MKAAAGDNESILVIEDDATIRSATVRLLRKEGYCVHGVDNGLEAMRYLRSHALPRLILLDLQMPVMDGWQFRCRQQQDPSLNHIPVVLLSSDEDLEETADQLHAASCLHKPVEEELLFDTLRDKVARRTKKD